MLRKTTLIEHEADKILGHNYLNQNTIEMAKVLNHSETVVQDLLLRSEKYNTKKQTGIKYKPSVQDERLNFWDAHKIGWESKYITKQLQLGTLTRTIWWVLKKSTFLFGTPVKSFWTRKSCINNAGMDKNLLQIPTAFEKILAR